MAGLQLGGLVSGMDTQSIIDQLMTIDKQKITTKQTKINEYTKKKDMWTDIELKLLDLKFAGNDLTRTSTFMTKEATSSDSNKVSAKSEAGSPNATYTLTNVTPAVAGKVTGTAVAMSNGVKGKIEGNNTWDDALGAAGLPGNIRFSDYPALGVTAGTVTINGASISIASTDTLNLVATKINGSSANITATVGADGKLTLEAKNAGDVISIDPGDSNFFTKFGIDGGAYTPPVASDYVRTLQDIKADGSSTSDLKNVQAGFFTLNNFTFEVKETDTVSSILKQINSSNAGVSAVYDSNSKKFTFTAKDAGKSIVMENDTSNFLHSVGVMGVENTTETYVGTGSSYTINGVAMTGETNDIVVDGTTISLKSAIAAGESETITVTNKSDKAVEKIKTFIEKYNAVVDLIEENSKAEVVNKKNTSTDTANSSKYENSTVSKGVLNGDPTASQIVNSLRKSLTGEVSNVASGYNQLALIGITAADSKSSHLTLDEETLKSALDKSPEEVFKLFSNSGKEKTKTVSFVTGNAATISSSTDINLGTYYTGADGTAIQNRKFSDYSSGVTSGSFTINGKSIYVASSDTITDVMDKINGAGAGVTASFASGKLTLTGNNINESMSLSAGTTTFLYKTGILQEKSEFDGVSARLASYIEPMTKYKGTLDNRKTYFEKQIEDTEDWITSYAKKMEDKQNRYIKQFAAMEKAMNTANNQSAWLSSQLSSLG